MLSASHKVDGFACGQADLDTWLAQYALGSQGAGMARTYVSTDDNGVVLGFYALATGGVEPLSSPARVITGVARHQVPVRVLARLAVDQGCQGEGLGSALLRDALIRVNAVSGEVGVRALLIHAKDESAKRFYMSFGEFEESPTDPMHLFLLMKDLRKALRG